MIIDQLKNDIENAIQLFLHNYSANKISRTRSIDIEIIRKMLLLNDPIQICKRLNNFLNNISKPLLFWLPFLELNVFINSLRAILSFEKYQEIALLNTLLNEKEQTIAQYRNTYTEKNYPLNNILEQKLDALILDIDLLKKENSFLYKSLEAFDQKIKRLEQENRQFLDRAKKAEDLITQSTLTRHAACVDPSPLIMPS